MPRTPIALALFIALCGAVLSGPPMWDQTAGPGASIDKHDRLERLGAKKVVLIGGSNVMTGLDSAEIERALSRGVVNMGMSVSFGLRYMLEEVKGGTKAGDLLVIFPEYDLFAYTSETGMNPQVYGSNDVLQVAQAFPGALAWIAPIYLDSPSGVFNLLNELRRMIHLKIDFYQAVLTKIGVSKAQLSLKLLEPTRSLYTWRNKYNTYGDFVGHLRLPSPGFAWDALGQPYQFNRESLRVLQEFCLSAEAKGARVVVIPPAIPEPNFQRRKKAVEDIYMHWQELKSASVLSPPSRYVLKENLFFDSPYHPNARGRELRTQRVVEDLSNFLSEHKSCDAGSCL